MPLRIGTRGSALARWQAEWVASRLTALGTNVTLVPISTAGDREQRGPIAALGATGAFTKELQQALVRREIDLAVHSLKDLPTDVVPGVGLAAVPERAPIADALLSRDGRRLLELPQGAVVGTGSLRRRAQLWRVRPDLRMQDVRGNVDTRLRKLAAGDYDALILAEAGLRRLGLAAHITELIGADVMLPAIGQGALGLEARNDDATTRELVARIDHPESHRAVLAERALLLTLRGGCLAPVGAWGRMDADGRLQLDAVVLSHDGRQRLASSAADAPARAVALGEHVASDLLAQGAAELIQAARQ